MYIEVGGKLVGEYLPRHGHTYVCTHAQTDTWTDNPIKTIISNSLTLTHPTCLWRPVGGDLAEIFGTRKLESLGHRVALCV